MRSYINVEKLDPGYDDTKEFKYITRNAVRGFNLDHTVLVICREAFGLDGSTTNACVRKMTKGRARHDWRGPLFVFSQGGTDRDPYIYQDIKAGDLRIVIDYFLAYGNPSIHK